MSLLTFYTVIVLFGLLLSVITFSFILYKYYQLNVVSNKHNNTLHLSDKIPKYLYKELATDYKDIQTIKYKNGKEYTRQMQRWQLKASNISKKYNVDMVQLITDSFEYAKTEHYKQDRVLKS
ncbi:hypothetical protein [Kangiella sp. TOML190]|uniref:hypothetical protein n=1 Tax=Kangiella sp. TOML190 TaxID=2931351 RepID=UPI00203BA6D7|nr:hypothetical protein [Kangiella sp. TOML190]